MKTFTTPTRTVLAVLALAAAATVQAQDANGEKTRQQVLAELAQAQRNGELIAAGERGQPTKDLLGSAVSRGQVQADVARAQRSGTLVAAGERGQLLDETVAPAVSTAVAKTRAQVKAEFADAAKSGDLLVAGEAGVTRREAAPLAYRGVVEPSTTLAKRAN
ncbi:DUF4148 domain-containing protein [Aquabacterium humicola]|uniref:DUF4148 domain-containing protein n=1 Tax=Aquabacterium humicola TaxID=3237377 RepID=UPI002542BE77|nr:DUF4148 domain-containing protein [Rubrivivax pictus]